ncbi:MAG: tail fiber domain-containing protein [Polyangiaceae bacterium]
MIDSKSRVSSERPRRSGAPYTRHQNKGAPGRGPAGSWGPTRVRAACAALIGAACAASPTDARAQVCSSTNGCDNYAYANYSAVLGGELSTIQLGLVDISEYSVIGGGNHNETRPGSAYSTVAGGTDALVVAGTYAFIGGGGWSTFSNNMATIDRASVMGGRGGSPWGPGGAIGGGMGSETNSFAVVLGGNDNYALGLTGVIGGGTLNVMSTLNDNDEGDVIIGGASNEANHDLSVVLGGKQNWALGSSSVVLGGFNNWTSDDYTLAGGRRARANKKGCFVWADAQDQDIDCTLHPPSPAPALSLNNAFVVRAGGGVEFVTYWTGAGVPSAGVYVPHGGSAWYYVSDRNKKHGLQQIDPREVLLRVVGLPITTWRYKDEVSGARHMGPMAQDFHAAFGLGDDDRHVTSIDEAGVVFGAIQGLEAEHKDRDRAVSALRDRVSARERVQAAAADDRVGTARVLTSAEALAAAIEAKLGASE